MGHLTTVARQLQVRLQVAKETERFSTNVYGSSFCVGELPRNEMPEGEMPRQVAYRLIRDHLSLDGNPILNLASFVTTYMEDEAENLMNMSFSKNLIDYEEYPQSTDIQNRCVSMIGHLFHTPSTPARDGSDPSRPVPDAVGTSTVGSSEAIMLAVLAMKKRWQKKRRAAGLDASRPNIIMSSAVQVCWEKAARYFEVEERFVYCSSTRFVLDPAEAVNLIDENTIGMCLILGTTYTGHYEDVKAVNDLLVEKGLDTPIHVDAASGGFVAPFIVPELEWDFRCERVVSINVSGHKYGLVYPGVGWVVWRSDEFLPQELVFNINYLGADQASFTLNFSRGASQIVGQYYQLIRLGKQGYRAIMANLTRTTDYLADSLAQMGFIILSETHGRGIPLVAFRLPTAAEEQEQQASRAATATATTTATDNDNDDEPLSPSSLERHYDEFALARQLRMRGWIVPAYTMAPHANHVKLLRVVVREDFSRSLCDSLLADIRHSRAQLDVADRESLKSHEALSAGRLRRRSTYTNETHSLQGKTGKTHAIC